MQSICLLLAIGVTLTDRPTPWIWPNRVVFQFSSTRKPAYILPTVSRPFLNSWKWSLAWLEGTDSQPLERQHPSLIPSLGGISLSIIFLACSGHNLLRVCLSSRSAWSISSAGLILMLRFSRIKANKVLVKFTLPSSVKGMFIRISFCDEQMDQPHSSVFWCYLVGQSIGTFVTETQRRVHIPKHVVHLWVVYKTSGVRVVFGPHPDVLVQVMGAQNWRVTGQVVEVVHDDGNE